MGKTKGDEIRQTILYLDTKKTQKNARVQFTLHSFVGALKNGFDLLMYVFPETGCPVLEALQTD